MNSILKMCGTWILISTIACNSGADNSTQIPDGKDVPVVAGGQENVADNESEKDIVKVAVSSKDHTTLVTALKQADLVTSLSNAGPFTVFAPTNAAFDKLPAGTLDKLMQAGEKESLRNILQYHVTLSALKPESLQDGQVLGMVNGDNVTVEVKNGKIILNHTAHVITTIPASNGMIYVIDAVLLPPVGQN